MNDIKMNEPNGEAALAIMKSLLDIEWKQATEGFATSPNGDNWQRMLTIMHARQRWSGKDQKERAELMTVLMPQPIYSWIAKLYEEQMEEMKSIEVRAAVRARHATKR